MNLVFLNISFNILNKIMYKSERDTLSFMKLKTCFSFSGNIMHGGNVHVYQLDYND